MPIPIAAEDERRFVQAMEHVRLSRLRTAATRWGLFRDNEAPRRFVELFVVPSWEEHLRQHGNRLTGPTGSTNSRPTHSLIQGGT
jgi:hypothetical protein